MRYDELIGDRQTHGSIRNWINNSSIPSTTVLTEAQAWIYQRLRVRQMLKTDTGTLTAGTDDSITLPSDFRQPKTLMFTGTATTGKWRPRLYTLEEVLDAFEWDGDGNRTQGAPQRWAVDATKIQFEVVVDKAYPYRLDYYAALEALGPTNTTNFLTDEYPTLLRCACLFKAAEFLRAERDRAYWANQALREIAEADIESDKAQFEGADLEITVA